MNSGLGSCLLSLCRSFFLGSGADLVFDLVLDVVISCHRNSDFDMHQSHDLVWNSFRVVDGTIQQAFQWFSGNQAC